MKPIDAEFLGYQEIGNLRPLPLFNIVKRGHKAFQSTVSALTLEREGLNIPYFPSFKAWKVVKEKYNG